MAMSLNWQCKEAMDDAKATIVDYLSEHIGENRNVGDLGFEITEDENNDGYWIVGTQKSVEEAIKNWGLSQYVVDYGKNELDADYGKEFWENPEGFWCVCMIVLVEHVWNKLVNDLKLDAEGDEIEITEDLVSRVEEGLKKYDFITQVGMDD